MPRVLLERVPLPSLRTYSSVSALFLSLAVYYATTVNHVPNWRLNSTDTVDTANIVDADNIGHGLLDEVTSKETSWILRIQNTMYTMMQEPFCVWVSNEVTLLKVVYGGMLGIALNTYSRGQLRKKVRRQ